MGYIITSLHTKVLNSDRLDIQILINNWIFSSMFLNRYLKDKNYDLIFFTNLRRTSIDTYVFTYVIIKVDWSKRIWYIHAWPVQK